MVRTFYTHRQTPKGDVEVWYADGEFGFYEGLPKRVADIHATHVIVEVRSQRPLVFILMRSDRCVSYYQLSIRENLGSSPRSSSTSKSGIRRRGHNDLFTSTSLLRWSSMTMTSGRLGCPRSSPSGSWSFRRESRGRLCASLGIPIRLALLDNLPGSILPLVSDLFLFPRFFVRTFDLLFC